jgi:hypothetical protein
VCFRVFVCDSELRLGYRMSSSEKEFLAAPIHSPPLWFAVSVLQMARDTLGYEYTGDDDTSRMPGDEVGDNDIVDRLSRIFKDMTAYTSCPVPEYSAARPPNKVSSRSHCRVLITEE